MIGEGSDKTKFNVSNSVIAFQTVNESSTPGTYADDSSSTSLNQARKLHLEGFTIATTSTTLPALVLQSCKMSNIADVKFTGPWTTGSNIVTTNAAIKLGSLSSIVGTQQNKFDHVMITTTLSLSLFCVTLHLLSMIVTVNVTTKTHCQNDT